MVKKAPIGITRTLLEGVVEFVVLLLCSESSLTSEQDIPLLVQVQCTRRSLTSYVDVNAY